MDRFLREGSSPLPSWKTLPREREQSSVEESASFINIDTTESFASGIPDEVDFNPLYCPHHPRNVCYRWLARCKVCRIIHTSLMAQKDAARNNVNPESFPLENGPCNGENLHYNPLDYHPGYRFSRWPHVSAFCVSTEKLPPLEAEGLSPVDFKLSKRERRRIKAERKYPQRLPRKGSDTNPLTFTGKVLLIRKEGLATIGRSIEGSKSTNASGQSWKC